MYHIGIIDFLQTWDFNKKCERFLKSKFTAPKNIYGISAINPNDYKTRFVDFLTSAVFKKSNHDDSSHPFGMLSSFESFRSSSTGSIQ